MSANEAADERPSKRLKTSPSPERDQIQSLDSSLAESPVSQTDFVTEKEQKVGISNFVSGPKPILRGLVKKRYADFLVNEILPGGRVLHLTKATADKEGADAADATNGQNEEISTPAVISAAEPKVATESSVSTSTEKVLNGTQTNTHQTEIEKPAGGIPEILVEDKATLISYLNEQAVTDILALHSSIHLNPTRKLKDHPTVQTEFTTDRTLRAHIHQAIRRIFGSKIDSSTTHEGVLVLTAASQRPQNQHSDRSRNPKPSKLSWSERGGQHCHFTLYKENKDTMEVLSLLARFLKMNTKELGFAGTKDRRAVTVQRVSARRVDAQRLAALNRTLRMVVLGDFEYREHEVGLGQLEGNEFLITLRDVGLHDSQQMGIEERRFKIGKALKQGMMGLAERGFLNYFGLQRFGTFATRSDIVGLKLLNGDFEGACDAILEYSPAALDADAEEKGLVGREDRARAQAISTFKKTGRVKECLETMPKRFSAETAVIRSLGKNERDFLGAVLAIQYGMRSLYVHAYQSMVWNMAASERWRLFGDKVVEGDLVLVREHREKQGQAPEEAVDADGEVVIQASGEDRAKVADEMFERARVLTQEEAQSGKYDVFDIVLPQPGYDVLYPHNASGEFYKRFMGSEAGGGLDPHEMRRKQRDFSLPGAYRKMVARIGAEWSVDVKRYELDEEQFVETDYDRVKKKEGDGVQANGEMGEKIAAVLRFQLGTSQYATMALRELSGGGVREYKPEFSGGR